MTLIEWELKRWKCHENCIQIKPPIIDNIIVTISINSKFSYEGINFKVVRIKKNVNKILPIKWVYIFPYK